MGHVFVSFLCQKRLDHMPSAALETFTREDKYFQMHFLKVLCGLYNFYNLIKTCVFIQVK